MKRIDQAFRESTAGVDISILEDKYRAKVVSRNPYNPYMNRTMNFRSTSSTMFDRTSESKDSVAIQFGNMKLGQRSPSVPPKRNDLSFREEIREEEEERKD